MTVSVSLSEQGNLPTKPLQQIRQRQGKRWALEFKNMDAPKKSLSMQR
jgi:hypothetical protein